MWISKQVVNLFYLYTSIIIIIIKFKIVTLLQKMIIYSRFFIHFLCTWYSSFDEDVL